MDNLLFALITRLAYEIPSILIWIIGFSLSLYFRKQNRKKYLLATIAFVIFFVNTIGNSVISTLVMMDSFTRGVSSPVFIQIAVYFFSTLGSTIAWGILFFVLFGPEVKLDKGFAP